MNDMSHTYEPLENYDAALGKVVVTAILIIGVFIAGVIFL